jgi:hypothetical protein
MVDKASLDDPRWSPSEENGRRPSAAVGVREGVGELLSDIVSLGELQAQLLMVDARESMQKARTPILLLVVGAVLGLGATPVLLIALAEGLMLLFELKPALAYLVSGLVGALVGGLLIWLAWRQSGDVIAVFLRSRTELAENIRWIKHALTRGRRPPR